MMYFDKKKQGFVSSLLEDHPIEAVFGTRQLTRKIVASSLKMRGQGENVIVPRQVHGKAIAVIDSKTYPGQAELLVDGLITATPHTALTVTTADCVPLILYDAARKIIGISHQGWRGVLEKLPEKMVLCMRELGTRPGNIVAAIGPSINECCYDVPADRYHRFASAFPYAVKNGYTRRLNLQHITYLQLQKAGVGTHHIDHFPFCTRCDEKRFFSFRRGNKNRQMISVVCLI